MQCIFQFQVIQDIDCKDSEKLKKKITDKVKESLVQASKDLSSFLAIFPDLIMEGIENLKFTTMSFLPATSSKHLDICNDCHNYVAFREDLNPYPRVYTIGCL